MSAKKKKKGDKPSTAETAIAAEPVQTFELPITIVQQQLDFHKRKCEELTLLNIKLENQLNGISTDQNDAVEYLQSELKIAKGEIEEYKEQSLLYQQERDKIKVESKKMVEDFKTEVYEEIDHWKQEYDRVSNELQHLNEFRRLKTEMEEHMSGLEKSLEDKDRDFKEMVHATERKMLQEKTQMKKEVIQKVNDFAQRYHEASEQEMAETTKKAIKENVMIKAHLRKLNARLSDLMLENETLRERNKRLKDASSSMDKAQDNVLRKHAVNQKFMRVLIEKLKQNDKTLEEAIAKFKADIAAGGFLGTDVKRARHLFLDIIRILSELTVQSAQIFNQPNALVDAPRLADEIIKATHSGHPQPERIEELIWCAKRSIPRYNHTLNSKSRRTSHKNGTSGTGFSSIVEMLMRVNAIGSQSEETTNIAVPPVAKPSANPFSKLLSRQQSQEATAGQNVMPSIASSGRNSMLMDRSSERRLSMNFDKNALKDLTAFDKLGI